jgi:hypothetical protein
MGQDSWVEGKFFITSQEIGAPKSGGSSNSNLHNERVLIAKNLMPGYKFYDVEVLVRPPG